VAGLARVQRILRDEILNVREVMQEMNPVEIAPSRLPAALSEIVNRFSYDSGIDAVFRAEGGCPRLNQQGCADVARVVREALANVRKHSGARRVSVRLVSTSSHTTVVVTDDGRGFGFNGRLTFDALESGSPDEPQQDESPGARIPSVLKGCVQSVQGKLEIESRSGSGARVTVVVPARRQPEADLRRAKSVRRGRNDGAGNPVYGREGGGGGTAGDQAGAR
jgi:signal transduction histidine kinase